ncbi:MULTISPECIES: hypothetical protein [Chromohalobacter]|uniref:Uncharacterized protein n=1 Tax=Chromohalobacter canadensis TaxID=141389 RepID=A0A285VLI0_9GAMM|nr:hypothetical protein [Chromohalobacter canadensis]MCK0767286.1 hypothetical protein [Chromohalobacter canadensis]WQH10108.1 hypothetical protein SR908_05420 [Chromohalobacter canadensis]SOC53441.1 hypothetical protein SAMN05421509_102357 [Chromohalobacter canadensis]
MSLSIYFSLRASLSGTDRRHYTAVRRKLMAHWLSELLAENHYLAMQRLLERHGDADGAGDVNRT